MRQITYLKLKEIRSGIKVVLITGHRQTVGGIVSQAIDSNVYACLFKPFDVRSLANVFHSLIQGKSKTEIQSQLETKQS